MPDFSLKVNGEVAHPLNLTVDDWKTLPRRFVRAKDHDGKESEYEGVELGEILKLAGVKFGEALRGRDLALFLVEAADRYRAVFALPELDHAFTDRVLLLADRRDGNLSHRMKARCIWSCPTKNGRRVGCGR